MSQTENNQTENQENSPNNQDSDDLSEKYDATLTALSQEYYSYIETIRQADEKANKYLVVISIFVAGFFTAITSSLTDKLSFNTTPLTGVSFLTWLFIILFTISLIYGILVVKGFLQDLSFVKTSRLPDLASELNKHKNKNSNEYRKLLIDWYQSAINNLYTATLTKQKNIKSSTNLIPYFLCSMVSSVIVLFLIKLMSK